MEKKVLDFVCCPSCCGELRLSVFDGNGHSPKSEGNEYTESEATTGILKCGCGMVYPIIDGVPRLLTNSLSSFPKFVETYREKLRSEIDSRSLEQGSSSKQKQDDYDYIRRSFSVEWGVFDYTGDKTWGWTLDERKDVFLGDVAFNENQLRGKTLLDAGCGNGTLTAALTAFGLEIVGIDLNEGLGLANRNRARYAGERSKNVNYVHGNIFNAPLKKGSFDLIYCSGVIHHTPNSKETFKKLVPLVRTGGRLYVWVYGRRAFPVRMFMASGRTLKKAMPLGGLMTTCHILAPFYKFGTQLLDGLGVAKFRRRSVAEITLDLFDAFAPQYNHFHTEAEVQSWFEEQGFKNISVSGRQKHGFGVYGDKV